MFQILFICPNYSKYQKIKDCLPQSMNLIYLSGYSESLDYIHQHNKIDAIVLTFSNETPRPKDLQILQKLVGRSNIPKIFVMCSKPTPSQAVCIMRSGAYDCLTGPPSGEILRDVLEQFFDLKGSASISNKLIHGNSPEILQIHKKIEKNAKLSFPILISGETGSGKELVAKSIHKASKQKNGPFVPLICAAYPDDLLSSELFGSCKGAFTGSKDRIGIFEHASNGSVFLDEIGELSLSGQVKLLRVLEENKVRPIGSNKAKSINARVISATNQDLADLCEKKLFRKDLYYRLNLQGIKVPPLREHPEDIPTLVRLFLRDKFSLAWKIDSAAMKILVDYNWPGNVRELKSVIIKSSINASDNCIRAADLVF